MGYNEILQSEWGYEVIERDLLEYLQADVTLTTALGGVQKICVIQAQALLKMPYLTIEPTPGTRVRIGANKIEEVVSVRISLDYGPLQIASGRAAIERAKYLIENYRGNLNGANDILITCGGIGSWAGLAGCNRSQFTALCKFTETLVNRP